MKFSEEGKYSSVPKLNACDLGFFRSMDSRLPAIRSFNLDEFEQQCLAAYREYPSDKLTAIFDTKQMVCRCILERASVPGQNDYKLPHRREMNQ